MMERNCRFYAVKEMARLSDQHETRRTVVDSRGKTASCSARFTMILLEGDSVTAWNGCVTPCSQAAGHPAGQPPDKI